MMFRLIIAFLASAVRVDANDAVKKSHALTSTVVQLYQSSAINYYELSDEDSLAMWNYWNKAWPKFEAETPDGMDVHWFPAGWPSDVIYSPPGSVAAGKDCPCGCKTKVMGACVTCVDPCPDDDAEDGRMGMLADKLKVAPGFTGIKIGGPKPVVTPDLGGNGPDGTPDGGPTDDARTWDPKFKR